MRFRTGYGSRMHSVALLIALCGVLGGALAACGTTSQPKAQAGAPTHVVISQTSNSLGWTADYLAQKEGFFKKEGLDVTIQISSGGDRQVIPAVSTGSAQFGAIPTISMFQVMTKGQQLEIVAPYVNQIVAQFVMNKNTAQRLGITASTPMADRYKKIKGLKIATLDVGGSLDLLFRAEAKKYGLNPNTDVQITAINSYASMLAAVDRGQVDMALTAIPYGVVGMQKYGFVSFADFWGGAVPEFNGSVHEALYTTKQYASQHPQVVEAMRRAIDDALVFLHQHPDQALQDMEKQFPNLSPDALKVIVVDDVNSFPSHAIVSRSGLLLMRDFVAQTTASAAAQIQYNDVVLPSAQEAP